MEKPIATPPLVNPAPDARQPHTARLRWTLPDLHRYTLLAGLFGFFVALLPLLDPTDVDFWWHVRTGQLTLESGVPTHDIFSYTAAGQPWLEHEWLTQVIMYSLQHTLGYPALALLFGLVEAGCCLLVYRLLRFQGAGRLLALALLVAFFVLAYPTWGVRPQTLSGLFLAAFYLVLLSYRRTPTYTRALWLLPVLSFLWVNLHGTYITGLIIIAMFIIGEAINNFLYRPVQPTPMRPLLITLVASALATLLNPYFIGMWLLILQYLSIGGHNQLAYIQEWNPPDFGTPLGLLLAASFLLLMIVGLARPSTSDERQRWPIALPQRIDITAVIIVAGFTLQVLSGVKAAPLYGVTVLPLLAASLVRAFPILGHGQEQASPPVERRINWFIAVLGAALLLVLVLSAPQAQTSAQPNLGSAIFPVRAANYISALPASTRMYNDFGWGGYLLYRLYPQHLVFIDGRFDMYRGKVVDDYLAVQTVAPGWREILARYGVNLVVISPHTSLDYALAHESGWHVGFQDDTAIVYQRNLEP